jgi:hypothetical protein
MFDSQPTRTWPRLFQSIPYFELLFSFFFSNKTFTHSFAMIKKEPIAAARTAPTTVPHNASGFSMNKPLNANTSFSCPRSARRVPQPHREYSSEPVFEPAGRGTQGGFARSGVSFLLVIFLWTSKEKSPAVGQPPTSMRGRRPLDRNLPGFRCASSGLQNPWNRAQHARRHSKPGSPPSRG